MGLKSRTKGQSGEREIAALVAEKPSSIRKNRQRLRAANRMYPLLFVLTAKTA